MNTVLIFVALISMTSALSEEFISRVMEKFTSNADACTEESHASDDDIAELISKVMPPTTHEAKCMIFCFNKIFGFQNADGSIDKVGTLLALDEVKTEDLDTYKKALQVLINCGEIIKHDDDPCIFATNLAVCGKEQAKVVGIDEMSMMG